MRDEFDGVLAREGSVGARCAREQAHAEAARALCDGLADVAEADDPERLSRDGAAHSALEVAVADELMMVRDLSRDGEHQTPSQVGHHFRADPARRGADYDAVPRRCRDIQPVVTAGGDRADAQPRRRGHVRLVWKGACGGRENHRIGFPQKHRSLFLVECAETLVGEQLHALRFDPRAVLLNHIERGRIQHEQARLQAHARTSVCVSQNSSSPSTPPSRPKPDCFIPPNGASGVGPVPVFNPT